MFKKENRLAKNKDIQNTIKIGRVFFNPSLNIKYLKKSTPPTRFAVVVGTKVFKKAAQRNRIKRILREEVKKRITSLSSGNYAIFVKPNAAKITEAELLNSLKIVLNQVIALNK